MQKRRLRAPSPAFIISLIALFVALGGTSLAAATLINGKNIQKHTIAKDRLTTKAIKQLKGNRGRTGPRGAQGLQGVQGVQGLKGDKGDKGDTGAPGTAVAYAFVDSSGAVNETKSKNVADANVVKEATGVYCFYNLSFSFANVTVTGFQSSSGDDQDQFFQVGVPNVGAVVDYGACNNTPPIGAAGTENAFVKVYDQSAAALADGDFFIVFN